MWLAFLIITVVIYRMNRNVIKQYKEKKALDYIIFMEKEKQDLEFLKKKYKAPKKIKTIDELATWIANH